jgi:hypothetical protein
MNIARWTAMAALTAVLAGSPDRGRAQGAVTLTPFLGGTVFTNQRATHSTLARQSRTALSITNGRYQDAYSVGTFAGMHFDTRWELESMFSWSPSRLEASEGLSEDGVAAHVYMYGVAINFHVSPRAGVTPYASFGVGAETWAYDIPHVPAQTQLMVNAGGGIEFPLRDRTVFRFDLRDCVSWHRDTKDAQPDAMSHIMLVAGLSFAFPNSFE